MDGSPVSPDSGLEVGRTVPEFWVSDVNRLLVPSGDIWRERVTTMLLLSLDSPACDRVVAELQESPGVATDLGLSAILPDSDLARRRRLPLDARVFYQAADMPASVALQSHLTPHAFVVSPSGTVLARGVGSTVEALTALRREVPDDEMSQMGHHHSTDVTPIRYQRRS